MTATQMNAPELNPAEVQPWATLIESAVDVYDAAATLESQGYGDAVAKRVGHSDIFALASHLLDEGATQTSQRSAGRLMRGVLWALARMAVLFSGVVLSLACLHPNSAPSLVFIAGAVGWMSGQAISAGIWYGLGKADRVFAARIAATSAPVVAALALAASLIVNSPAPLLWSVWGIASSVLVIFRSGGKLLVLSLLGAGLTWLCGQASHDAGVVMSSTMIVVAALAAIAVLRGEKGQLGRLTVKAVGMQLLAVVQAVGQIVVLAAVLVRVGPTAFVTVAVAGLIAGALSDPILESTHALVRHVVTHPRSWRAGRRLTGLLGVAGICLVVLSSLGAATGLHGTLAPSADLIVIELATALVAAVTAGTGLLLRAGSALGAMLLAVAAAAATVAAVMPGPIGSHSDVEVLAMLGILALSLACALGMKFLSHPAAW